MMRYFYGSCFLVLGMGLPLLAKNPGTDNSTPSASTKAKTKAVPASLCAARAAAAETKTQNHKKSEITLTPDISRAAVSPSLLSKQEMPSPNPVRKTHIPERSAPSASPLVTKNSCRTGSETGTLPIRTETDRSPGTAEARLARVTAYWAAEGDYYTERCISATGVRLHDGHCAVDPSIIPYGSVVEITGVGKFLAVDTGSAVISRTAAREGGQTSAERHAIVVDLFFEHRSEGERFAAGAAKYVSINWWTPSSMGLEARAARSLFAEEDWSKIQGKQL